MLDRGTKLIGAIIGLGSIGGAIVTGMIMLAHNAAAEVVHPIDARVIKLEAVWPSIDRKLDILIETEGQREWRDHRVVIPSPSAARDGGQ